MTASMIGVGVAVQQLATILGASGIPDILIQNFETDTTPFAFVNNAIATPNASTTQVVVTGNATYDGTYIRGTSPWVTAETNFLSNFENGAYYIFTNGTHTISWSNNTNQWSLINGGIYGTNAGGGFTLSMTVSVGTSLFAPIGQSGGSEVFTPDGVDIVGTGWRRGAAKVIEGSFSLYGSTEDDGSVFGVNDTYFHTYFDHLVTEDNPFFAFNYRNTGAAGDNIEVRADVGLGVPVAGIAAPGTLIGTLTPTGEATTEFSSDRTAEIGSTIRYHISYVLASVSLANQGPVIDVVRFTA